MSEPLQQAKLQYNELLKRYKKYEKFVENTEIDMVEKLKWTPQAQELANDLSKILDTIKANGYEYHDGEVLNGFLI